jgi:hypothetical protein
MGIECILRFGINILFSSTKIVEPFDFIDFLIDFKHPSLLHKVKSRNRHTSMV